MKSKSRPTVVTQQSSTLSRGRPDADGEAFDGVVKLIEEARNRAYQSVNTNSLDCIGA